MSWIFKYLVLIFDCVVLVSMIPARTKWDRAAMVLLLANIITIMFL